MANMFVSGAGVRYFKIVARNKKDQEAFAEEIYCFRYIDGNDCVYVQNYNGDTYFADRADIVCNPDIIRQTSMPWLYKIRLGESVNDADF